MNVEEYGNFIRVNVGEDISTATNELRLISPEDGCSPLIKKAADGLVVGSIPFIDTTVTPNVTFDADEYVEYKLKQFDINIPGLWTARLFSQAADTSTCKITDVPLNFTVGE